MDRGFFLNHRDTESQRDTVFLCGSLCGSVTLWFKNTCSSRSPENQVTLGINPHRASTFLNTLRQLLQLFQILTKSLRKIHHLNLPYIIPERSFSQQIIHCPVSQFTDQFLIFVR